MNYYTFMFILSRTQIVQNNYRVENRNTICTIWVQDLINMDINLYLEYKLFGGRKFWQLLEPSTVET